MLGITLTFCQKFKINVPAAILHTLSGIHKGDLLCRGSHDLISQSKGDFFSLSVFEDVFLITGNHVYADSFQRFDDIFINDIKAVDGNLLPAERVEERIGVLLIVDGDESALTLGECSGGSDERGEGGCGKESKVECFTAGRLRSGICEI